MSPLDDCLAALIETLQAENAALDRQDDAAVASLLGSKTALCEAFKDRIKHRPASAHAHTRALMNSLVGALAANRTRLERSMRVRRHMLELIRQAAGKSLSVAAYSRSGGCAPATRVTGMALVTHA